MCVRACVWNSGIESGRVVVTRASFISIGMDFAHFPFFSGQDTEQCLSSENESGSG